MINIQIFNRTNEILVAHHIFLFAFKFLGDLVENSVYCFSWERVTSISVKNFFRKKEIIDAESLPAKIFFVDEKIMIAIKFPKFTIDDIEMLIGEKISNFVYILLVAHQIQSEKQIALFVVPPTDFSCVSSINSEENPINNSFS